MNQGLQESHSKPGPAHDAIVGFAIVDREGKVFGRYKTVYFTKAVSSKTAQRITSPDDAYRRKGENPKKVSVADVRKIVADSEEGSLIIREHLAPILSFHSTHKGAIHAAVKLIKQESPNSWHIKSNRGYGSAFVGPLVTALIFASTLFLTWHFATKLEAGEAVTPSQNFRHRGKSELAISIAGTIGTNGVKILVGSLVVILTLWTIWGVIHVDEKTTFTLKSRIGRRRKREKHSENKH